MKKHKKKQIQVKGLHDPFKTIYKYLFLQAFYFNNKK